MKTVTTREVQLHFSKILNWVSHGEEVVITRRGETVAKIVSAREDGEQNAEIPDFAARRKAMFGDRFFENAVLVEREMHDQ